MKRMAKFIAKKSGYDFRDILFCTAEELTAYWKSSLPLPPSAILRERRKNSLYLLEGEKIKEILVGKDVAQFSSIFVSDSNVSELPGQSAFVGKAQGVVRVIFDPSNVAEFNDGDILVAPWTRPEYLPVMKKAGAFVTDGGGILSHAAIVAREIKKPCIIGAKIATKVFKDGDVVEVDAERGIVKKLS